MKTLITFLFFAAGSVSLCRAQYVSVDAPKYKMVKQDTINIHGIVYDACGNPAQGVLVISQNKEIHYEGLPAYAKTDKDGKFTLNGALVPDTLQVVAKEKMTVINKGSRYLELHLPNAPVETMSGIGVHAKRTTAKKDTPVFKVLTNATVLDYFGVGGTSMAQFPGGWQRFVQYVNKSVKYPQKAIGQNIEGEVEIGFTVERDGTLSDLHVIRGIGYGCDEAVINVIKASPRWKPPIINGTPYAEKKSVIVNFKLDDK